MYAQRLKVMLTHSGEGDFAIRECGNPCSVRGIYGVAGRVVDDVALHICDILHTEQRQLAHRYLPNSFDFVHLIFSPAPGTARSIAGSSRARAARGVIGARLDLDSPHSALYLGTDQINVEKPIIQPRAVHLDALSQDKGSLELSGGDPAVQIYAPRIFRLLAAHDELVVLNRNAEVTHREAGYREGDLQGILVELFDIVRRISIARNLADPIERPFEMIEAQEQGRVEH
jgi:hypothetical protein